MFFVLKYFNPPSAVTKVYLHDWHVLAVLKDNITQNKTIRFT